MITLVIPSRNNLKYVKFAYDSIRKHLGNEIEVILLDDASTDGTWEWMIQCSKNENCKIYRNHGPNRIGHTVLYDVGASMASNPIFGIFHADMVATPNYVKNLLKHLKPKTVVCGTRIEPPLHPGGPEKFVMDFGMEPEVFQEQRFLQFVSQCEESYANKVTNGIFAPWAMYVEDFKAIGGHDKRVFAPMELEDSDLFNRFLLNGYQLIQSRDSFVYHMTCRGSRFKDGIKIIQEIPLGNGQVWKRPQDSQEYTALRQNKFREWWRKWHMDVLHDQNMLPIVHPRYNIGYKVSQCSYDLIQYIEPWGDTIYIESPEMVNRYIKEEQPKTKFDLHQRIKSINNVESNDVIVSFNGMKFNQQGFDILKQLPQMIKESGEIGMMEYDIFQLDIKNLNTTEKNLIHADNTWYVNQLVDKSPII